MSSEDIRELFERNANSYDWVNSIISAGLDSRWRRWVASQAARTPGARVLDVFSGTGIVGIEAATMGAEITLADISPRMLSIASHRAEKRGVFADIKLVDLTQKPSLFARESFDVITMVFGLRYIDHPGEVISKLLPLLKPRGKLIMLEFIVPSKGLLSTPASLYFFHALPRIGSFLARRRELYDYLISSVKTLGNKEDLLNILSSTGLGITEIRLFGFGLVCGTVSVKG